MGYIRPGIKMPRLPNVVGRVTKRDEPLIVGLDAQSSYVPGYDPANGNPVQTYHILQETGDILLTELGDNLDIEH